MNFMNSLVVRLPGGPLSRGGMGIGRNCWEDQTVAMASTAAELEPRGDLAALTQR
jgi:hypothetical protein